jgi:hypothetical protein
MAGWQLTFEEYGLYERVHGTSRAVLEALLGICFVLKPYETTKNSCVEETVEVLQPSEECHEENRTLQEGD